MPNPKEPPSILLVGVGRFGRKHLEKLLIMEQRGHIRFAGAIVATKQSKEAVEKEYSITVSTTISDDLLKSIDGVVIATPPETHTKIALRCLPFTNVLIEKPLATTSEDAVLLDAESKQYNHVLMVGHIFRFNSVIRKLKEVITLTPSEPLLVSGEFVNPAENDVGRDISLELPHYFDIMNWVFGTRDPLIVSTVESGRIRHVSLQYTKTLHAHFKLGWSGTEKSRFLRFQSSRHEIICDFLKDTLTLKDFESGHTETIDCSDPKDALMRELECFIGVIKGEDISYPNTEDGTLLVETALKARPKAQADIEKRPRVAVIGGGIFGANISLELATFADVTLFEKNADIMLESSYVNQYRHHSGYHYPRSDETVRDIRKAIKDFERLYDAAIIRDFPTYYCIAKEGSKTSPDEYIAFCQKHDLPFVVEYPDKKYVNREMISLSLKTLEPIYNYSKLKGLVDSSIKASRHIDLRLNTKVVRGIIEHNGQKTLVTTDIHRTESQSSFDYVVNATYASHNHCTTWFNFPTKPVRIDLVEALIVKLPLPKVSFAIMDGPFTNLVPTGEEHLFTLVHIQESILERYVPKDGIPHVHEHLPTNARGTLEKSMEWLPILKEAEVVEKRYVFRAVNAYREHDDARPSDLTYHGFGAWSVLGGKIVNCVTAAKNIAAEIKNQRGGV